MKGRQNGGNVRKRQHTSDRPCSGLSHLTWSFTYHSLDHLLSGVTPDTKALDNSSQGKSEMALGVFIQLIAIISEQERHILMRLDFDRKPGHLPGLRDEKD